MMRKDISGKRYGRLVDIRYVATDKFGQGVWLCKCDCGNTCLTTTNRLSQGKTKSCGCLMFGINKKHGLSHTRIDGIYSKMKGRCYTKTDSAYMNYGGRGITICDEWLGKDGFKNFVDWAFANGYSEKLSIDRIDNNKGYSPDNCRWTDRKTQSRNRRSNHLMTLNGETKTMAEWSEITGIKYQILYKRTKKYGWNDKKALTTEVRINGQPYKR